VAVTRSPAKAEKFRQLGWEAITADIVHPAQPLKLPPADEVLFAVGHERSGSLSAEEAHVQGLRQVLDALGDPPRRLIYISSTGVYGQAHAEIIDENSPCAPLRPGGRACLAAEECLRNSGFAGRGVVLRLAGIYGPGRLPRADDLLAGRSIDAPSDGYLNLIHVDDAASIIASGLADIEPPAMFVVSDGHPVIRREYYAEAARILGAPPPRFTQPDPASPASQRAGSDKRISPARLLAVLREPLKYPTYREGLAAIVRDARRN
jgi:nucleoside-diphosphate-sugar epimerase